MTLPRARFGLVKTAAMVAAVSGLVVILPAGAQNAPPQRGDNDGSRVPKYVDSADYDREPYYVDGVQYKPYVPDKKKPAAKPAESTSKPAAAKVTQSTPASSSYSPGELHPYVPPKSQTQASADSKSASSASSKSSAARASAEASASSSAAAYVPKKRARYGAAIIEALDKVTAENVRFEAPIGQPVRYKGLIYTVKACETTADDEPAPDVIAYMQVRTSPSEATNTASALKSKEIFRGWTFASAPSLNPIQHPVYDAWVIACRRPLAG